MGVMTCHPGETPNGVIYTATASVARGISMNGMRSGVTGVTWVAGSTMAHTNF
jgi:hypothetical protein